MTFPNSTIEIPEELLAAQEEGRVVFFCGAGISYDAGIPVFEGLLKATAEGLNHELSNSEKRLFRAQKFDELYQELERQFKRNASVRRVTEKFLRPVLDADGNAISKHCSLLKLAKAHDGATRLVTTNYDCLFDEALKSLECDVHSFAAPLLPIPKNYKWDGIVYLHGKLDKTPSDRNLLSLILSSGDFGQAYLTERWASRFVTELFRDHVICFVGYSVNDVILKYMMDALASEELQGGERHFVYAFANCTKGHEAECRDVWLAKGIRAIPYHVTRKKGHVALTHALQEWAKHYETGRLDKAVVVRSCLQSTPDTVSSEGRLKIERFQWALHDEVGARALSSTSDVSVQWIAHLPFGNITDVRARRLIVEWVSRHFKYPEALQWCVRNKGLLSEDDFNTLHSCLECLSDLNPALSELWRLFLSDMQNLRRTRFANWLQLRKSSPMLTAGLRQMFKSFIQPTLAISAVDNPWIRDPNDLRRYFEWDVVLDNDLSIFDEQEARQYLAELLPELTVALVDACSILKSLGSQDFSYMHLPDLSCEENRVYGKKEWYYLIVLLKNAVLGLEEMNYASISRICNCWCDLEYPAFYRLVLWCSARYKAISVDRVITWLGKQPEALWSDNCARELYEFFDRRAQDLKENACRRLLNLILNPDETVDANDYCKATRMEHLKNGQAALNEEALQFLDSFRREHADWALRNRMRDGIRVWDDDYGGETVKEKKDDFSVPVEVNAASRFFERILKDGDDGVRQFVSGWIEQNPGPAIRLLLDMGCKQDYWPETLWDILFSTLSDDVEKGVLEEITCEDVTQVPTDLLSTVRIKFAFWARAVAIQKVDSEPFRKLCSRFVFDVPVDEKIVGTESANAPYELVAEALLRNWFDTQPQKGAGLSEPYRSIFTCISNGCSCGTRFARRELLHQLSGMFVVDPEWSAHHLLPWLSWKHQPELACESWNHAVMMSRYEPELLRALWEDFAETGRRYESLGTMAREWYAAVLFHHSISVVSKSEKLACTRALKAIPDLGREQVFRQIYLRLSEAGERADAVWRKDVLPFLDSIWPGESKYVTETVFTYLADGILCLNETFPGAVKVLARFVTVETRKLSLFCLLDHGSYGADSLCVRYPQSSLELLSMLTQFPIGSELSQCLSEIAQADDSLIRTDDYKRLREKAECLRI